MIRWDISEVADLLTEQAPNGLIELWQALPPGTTTSGAALEAARRSSQIAIVQGLSLVEQKVVGAAGLSVGFRPEIFDRLASVPGFDTLTTAAELAITGNLDLATLTQTAVDLVVEIVSDVADLAGLDFAFADYLGGVLAVVEFVVSYVQIIVDNIKAEAAYAKAMADASLECAMPAYSAQLDKAQADAALAMIAAQTDWRDLFMPEARPFNPDYNASGWGPDANLPDAGLLDEGYVGFTCCRPPDGGRVIAPVGAGIGNRIQVGFPRIDYGNGVGYGCLPMCPDLPVHRAIIVNPGSKGGAVYDSARSLPQLAGLGQQLWRLMWGRGPAAFAVDGAAIANAWAEYLRIMRTFIGQNVWGIGGHPMYDNKVCDEWSLDGRKRALKYMFERVGASGAADNPDGIYSWTNATPVKAWTAFAEYQTAMLERIGVVYVDARSCAVEWRERVADAQRELLDHPTAVCEIEDVDAIPDPELRELVKSRRRSKGAQCYAMAGDKIAAHSSVTATDGPSTAPLGNDPRPIPPIPAAPALPRPSRGTLGTATASSGGGGLAVGLGVGAAVLALLLVKR